MFRDVFICHASEDKQAVVRPLADELLQNNISAWVDEAEIGWGDSITQKVNEGLAISRYVIVVLSKWFIDKNWPERELNASLNREASSGEVIVLPLVVGDYQLKSRILQKYPLLNDKRYLEWNGGPFAKIVEALKARLSKVNNAVGSKDSEVKQNTSTLKEIPLPKLRKPYTDREKHLFLEKSFSVFRSYFQEALSLLQNQFAQIDTDLTDINSEKFRCRIYANGKLENTCIIRIGGLSRSDSIAYTEGRHILNDSSYNELVSIGEADQELYLYLTMGVLSSQQNYMKMSPEKAAETLWRRFISAIEGA